MDNNPQKERDDKPVPLRLGPLKQVLQMWATEDDRSLHYLMIKLLKEAAIKKYNYPKNYFDKKAGTAGRRAGR